VYCILAAGTGKYGNFHDMESSDISQQMQVNFVSPLELIHNCLREFLKNNTKVIYFSSIASDMPIKNLSVYGASKRSMNYALKIL
jgi:short-subunit dehydrogenase